MKNSEKKAFKQAFDELNEEGYFEDFIARVKRLRSKTGNKPKPSSAAVASSKVYYAKRAATKKKRWLSPD